jgi:cell division protein FtsB
MRVMIAVSLVLTLPVSAATAQTPADEISQLKKELATLKADQLAFKRELALLKAGVTGLKKPNFAARLVAANSLNSLNDQQDAFAKLAVDAATWGEAKIVNDALGRINSSTIHQESTYKAAIRLAAAGQEEEAVALAKKINSLTEQQKALLKIARGDADEK